MKIIKRILTVVFIMVILIIGFVLLAPLLFKDQIVENVKQSVNSTVNAEVDFTDVDVSFLRSFPAIQITVDDLSVIGIDTFAGLPLVTAREASVDLDFWSVLSGGETGRYEIKAVNLTEPRVRILVMDGNLANYNIAKSDDSDTTSTEGEMLFQLENYSIENGYFEYDDRSTETYVEIDGLNHRGRGDFTLDVFDLDTESTFESLTIGQGGINYIDEAEGELDAVMNIDVANAKYTFLDNRLRLNALDLMADGSIALPAEDVLFDLTVTAPANDFRQLWSMVPAAYTAGYEDVKTAGTFALRAIIQGPYNGETETYPAFTVDLNVADGSVQYPGRPVAIDGIAATAKINSPSSNLDQLKVDVPDFRIRLGGDPFGGSFRLSTPLSDPNVDARIKGTIDLAKWASAMPLEGVSELAGKIVADVTFDNVRQSLIEAGRYDAVAMAGKAAITDLVYAAAGLPTLRLSNAEAEFTPRAVNIPDFAMKLGNSDLSGRASVENILAYFSPSQVMRGTAVVSSSFFDADEWVSEAEVPVGATPAEIAAADQNSPTLKSNASPDTELFNRFDFTVDVRADEIKYTSYRLKNSSLKGHATANRIMVDDMATTLGNSTISGSGTVNNAWDYYFGDEVLGGRLDLYSEFIDVADFMEDESAATPSGVEESLAVIPIPENVNIVTNVSADRVQYTNITLEEMSGELVVRDRQMVIQNGKTNLLGGRMDFAGAYDTSEPGDPGFRFHYDLKSLAFGAAFEKLNTFAALAPIAQFIEGQFVSDLVVEGKLGKDLYPILSTIDARGFLETLDAGLASFRPLQKIGDALNVKELKDRINLKGIKGWFTIEDGRVTVNPFDLVIAGIPMRIAGTHGLDMDMDYQIQAAVPRGMIEGNIVTGTAIGALDQLAGQASKLGLNIQPGDTLNVGIGLTGSIGNPVTKLKLLGTNQSNGGTLADAARQTVENEINGRVDSVKSEANAVIDSSKQVIADRVGQARDSVQNALQQTVNQARQDAQNRIRDAISLGKDTTKKDSTALLKPKVEVQETVNDIKKELTKFNPFKKKSGG